MKKVGKQTFMLTNPVNITSTACIVGPKEKMDHFTNILIKL